MLPVGIVPRKTMVDSLQTVLCSDDVVRAAVRIMTKFAESTEQEWVNKDWLIRQAEDAARSCNMNSYLGELIGYFRTWQKALTKNIQAMRRLENATTKTERAGEDN